MASGEDSAAPPSILLFSSLQPEHLCLRAEVRVGVEAAAELPHPCDGGVAAKAAPQPHTRHVVLVVAAHGRRGGAVAGLVLELETKVHKKVRNHGKSRY